MTENSEKLRQAQQAEFEPQLKYLSDPTKPPALSEAVSTYYMSYYRANRDLLYRSYLPGHLRKRRTFRDQLVIPSACIFMMRHACHDRTMSGGYLAYNLTFDKVRDTVWWATFHHDNTLYHDCEAC